MVDEQKPPQRHKGRCIKWIQRPQTWCGEGDLVSPAPFRRSSGDGSDFRHVATEALQIMYS